MRIITGSLAGAVVLMIWGSFYWIMSGIPEKKLSHIENESEIVQVLQKNISKSGRYILPWFNSQKFNEASAEQQQKIMEDLFARHKEGPLVTIIYRKDGMNPMEGGVYAQGFFHFFISCLLASILLTMGRKSFDSFGKRFLCVLLLGVFASIYHDFSDPIWFHYPWGYHLYMAFFHITGWLFASLAIAGIVKENNSEKA